MSYLVSSNSAFAGANSAAGCFVMGPVVLSDSALSNPTMAIAATTPMIAQTFNERIRHMVSSVFSKKPPLIKY